MFLIKNILVLLYITFIHRDQFHSLKQHNLNVVVRDTLSLADNYISLRAARACCDHSGPSCEQRNSGVRRACETGHIDHECYIGLCTPYGNPVTRSILWHLIRCLVLPHGLPMHILLGATVLGCWCCAHAAFIRFSPLCVAS